jgi:DNA polymerase I-like protein with 3'-5' exonuclease and polymerase domains
MAVLSKDHTMLSMCMPGEDAHGYMGAQVGNWSYAAMRDKLIAGDAKAKELRQLGKVANLSCQYRTSAKTLIRVARVGYKLTVSESEARAIHATYRTTYPEVLRYWRDQIDRAKMRGAVGTVAGRTVNLGKADNPMHKWGEFGWSMESTAINFPIQGSGADQKYLALALLRDYLPKVDGRFYFELHDGMFVLIPDRYADKAVHDIRRILSNLPYKKAWDVDLPIQFPVDAKVGKSWGDLREVKE